MPTLFALLISISQYAHPEWPPLIGTHSDTSAYNAYLRSYHSVPPENILILKDSEATREGIIERGFKQHLIGCKRMREGDGVLIVFAGHGTKVNAPDGWPVSPDDEDEGGAEVESGDASMDETMAVSTARIASPSIAPHPQTKKTTVKPKIEMIVPYDQGTKDPQTGRKIPGIPDRTLGALLDQLAKKHPELGENITIVLDCCNSGHGTRKKEREDVEDTTESKAREELDKVEAASAVNLDSKGEANETIFYNRGHESSLVTELDPDIDKDILCLTPDASESDSSSTISTSAQTAPIRGRSAARHRPSHVLIAACGRTQQAIGDDKGGLLTRHLISALKDPTINPKTYTEVMKKVNEMIRGQKSWVDKEGVKRALNQKARCEGLVRDRLVFTNRAANANLFRLTDLDPTEGRSASGSGGKKRPPLCRIEAGEVQGVQVGTEFDVYNMDDRLHRWSVLGTTIATHVFPTYCFAEFMEERPQRTSSGSSQSSSAAASLLRMARIVQPYKLRFAVVNNTPTAQWAQHIESIIEKGLKTADTEYAAIFERIDLSTKSASKRSRGVDLVLEISDEQDKARGQSASVSFIRHDDYLRRLDVRPPRLSTMEVEKADFPKILFAIAKFNFYLSQESRIRSYANYIDFQMYTLGEKARSSERSIESKTGGTPRVLKKQIEFRDGEVKIAADDEEDYAFVIRNNTSTPLHPYLVYFDPNTYAIETWYAPFEANKPTLIPAKDQPDRQLQIGASSEHSEPFGFYLPPGEDRDTSFLKLFLLDSPAPAQQMEDVNQEPVVGCDEDGNKHVLLQWRATATKKKRGEGGDERRKRGVKRQRDAETWDCLLRKITVRKRFHRSESRGLSSSA